MKYGFFLLMLLSGHVAFANESSSRVENSFSSIPVAGTIVVKHLNTNEQYVFNEKRAKTPFAVASTFKIPNTLIAVKENLVSGKDSLFHWDGHRYDIETWNSDQTLASAFAVSCVWCYQAIARKVGPEKYKQYIHTMSYGILPERFDVENFWLDGTLKLNAFEQVTFLEKLFYHQLPFSEKTYGVLRDVMRVEANDHYVLYAKSGWARQVESPVGWYVGYLEGESGIWLFATNLAINDPKYLDLRKNVSLSVLKALGAISSEYQ